MEFIPIEVISHILEFLPSIEDRKAASLVCKLWYEAYQNPNFRKNEMVEIRTNRLFNDIVEVTNSNRMFWNVKATKVGINKDTKKFWDRFGPFIKSLEIESCNITEKSFMNVILRCDDLESLSIQNCRELMSGNLLEDEDDRTAVKKKLYRLTSLNLGYNRYLSDSIFVRFASICGNLQELHLSGCNISCHPGLYRKFYKNGRSNPSEDVFTFPFVSDFIRENAEKLKVLSFCDTLIDGDAVSCIAQTKGLALRELNLRGCLELTNACIKILSDFQLTLTHLDVAMCPRVTDASLLVICSRLTKLERFSIQGCRGVTDVGVSNLWRLTELSRLNISDCELIRDEGIIMGLCRRQNKKLEELNMSNLIDVTDNSIIQLMDFIPNIKVLILGRCYNAVTDRSVQSIFSNAKYLNTLDLNKCQRFTDRGLTGIPLESPKAYTSEGKTLFRIPLGSKEEVKIIRDAKLKQDVQEIWESARLNSDPTGSSLSNLRHLQHLNLQGCSQISDVSMKYAFKMNDLRSVNLDYCYRITSEGLCYLCENNRAIEKLDLDNCDNLTDTAVEHIFKNLPRLKFLTIGSKHITDNICDYLGSGCPLLKTLHLRNCPQLSASSIMKLLAYRPKLYCLQQARLMEGEYEIQEME